MTNMGGGAGITRGGGGGTFIPTLIFTSEIALLGWPRPIPIIIPITNIPKNVIFFIKTSFRTRSIYNTNNSFSIHITIEQI
jgi:hypothetical protein